MKNEKLPAEAESKYPPLKKVASHPIEQKKLNINPIRR